jgi:hypothetical protein
MPHRSKRDRSLKTVMDNDLVAAWRGGAPRAATAIADAFRAGALDHGTLGRVAAQLGQDGALFRNAVDDAAWRREWRCDSAVFAAEASQWLLAVPVVGTRRGVAAAAAQPLFRRQLERAMVRAGFVDATSTVLLAPTVVDMATLAEAPPQCTHDLLDAALTQQSDAAPSPGVFAEAASRWGSARARRCHSLDVFFLLGTRRATFSEAFPLLEALEDRRVIESEDRDVDQLLPAPQAVHVDHRDHLCCEDVLTAVEAASESWALAVEGLERWDGLFDIRPPVPWSAATIEGAVASARAQFFAPAAGQISRRDARRRNRLHVRRDARFVRMMLEDGDGLRGPAVVPDAWVEARVGSLARWMSDEVVWHDCRASMPWRAHDA